MCHCLLDQSVVNHAIDQWRRRLSRPVSTLKVEILNITCYCYTQNNNIDNCCDYGSGEMSTVNSITVDDFLFSFAMNINEKRIIVF